VDAILANSGVYMHDAIALGYVHLNCPGIRQDFRGRARLLSMIYRSGRGIFVTLMLRG
jgi:hypothetical protein